MSVKRWDATGVDCNMGEFADGDYVLHTDYVALEAENAELKRRLGEQKPKPCGTCGGMKKFMTAIGGPEDGNVLVVCPDCNGGKP